MGYRLKALLGHVPRNNGFTSGAISKGRQQTMAADCGAIGATVAKLSSIT